MSSDNGLILNLKTFDVSEYQGEEIVCVTDHKTLEEAIKFCQKIEKEWGTEYGVRFVGKLKKKNEPTKRI